LRAISFAFNAESVSHRLKYAFIICSQVKGVSDYWNIAPAGTFSQTLPQALNNCICNQHLESKTEKIILRDAEISFLFLSILVLCKII